MALVDQLFTQIIANPPVINPGVGGWDAILNQFLADRRGRHSIGLLSRLIDVTGIPGGTTGMVLFTCPPGWRAMPLCVAVFASQNPAGGMNFTIGSGISTGDRMWAKDVVLNGGATALPWGQMPFLVFPYPNADNFFANSGTPQQIPVVDGDDFESSETFRVALDGAQDITYSFFVYGMAWPTSD